MSDKVLNGVPRELLERTICRLTHGHEHDKAVRELRALLTAQPQASATQPAPAGEREAVEVAAKVSENTMVPELIMLVPLSYGEQLMTVAQHERILAAWQRTQAAGVPDGERLAELLESVRLGDDEAKPHGSGATYWNNAVLACQVAIRDALDAAPAQPAAQQDQGWIPVSERLPESETDVLVRCVRHGNDVRHVVAGLFHDEWSSQETEYPIAGKATHWMPLPAAPGEKSGLPNNPMRQDQGEVQRLREALRKIMEAHRFNVAAMPTTEVHSICFDALAASTGQEVE